MQSRLRQLIYEMSKPASGGGFFGDSFAGNSLDMVKWTKTIPPSSAWTIDVSGDRLLVNAGTGGSGTTIANIKSVRSDLNATDATIEVEFYSSVRSSSTVSEGHYIQIIDSSSKTASLGWEQSSIYALATGMSSASLNYAYQVTKLKMQHFSSNNSIKFWAYKGGVWVLVKDSGTLTIDVSEVSISILGYEYHGTAILTPTKWWNLTTDIPI